jgi:hypothetical protein
MMRPQEGKKRNWNKMRKAISRKGILQQQNRSFPAAPAAQTKKKHAESDGRLLPHHTIENIFHEAHGGGGDVNWPHDGVVHGYNLDVSHLRE